MRILKRSQAIKEGLPRYFTGKPCPRGHTAERNVNSRHCTCCEKEKSSLYRATRPEYARSASKRSYSKHADKIQKRHLAYQGEHREYYRQKSREHYKLNPEYYQNLALNRTKIKHNLVWWKIHLPELILIYQQCKHLSKVTGIKHQVDHIVPLIHKNVCGLHVPWNLQILTAEANRQKSNRFPY